MLTLIMMILSFIADLNNPLADLAVYDAGKMVGLLSIDMWLLYMFDKFIF